MCGYTCIRYLVFFFNVLFFITGCALVGTGAYLKIEKDDGYLELCDKYSWATGAIIFLVVGAIILIIAFFGCVGAWKQSSVMLTIFFIFLLIIFVLELAAGIYAATERSKVEDELQKCMNETLRKNYEDSEGLRNAWKKFQKEFKCCGITGVQDYKGITPTPNCPKGSKDTGCYEAFKNKLKDNLVIVIGVGIAFALIQILGMVMSLWMVCQIKGRGEIA